MAQSNLMFIGIKGSVIALDRATGQEVWRAKLKGGDFVNVVLLDGDLYGATKGEVFCLDVATGAQRWHNPLTGLGTGLITIASPGGQQSVIMREKQERDQEEQAAAAAAVIASGV